MQCGKEFYLKMARHNRAHNALEDKKKLKQNETK
jgi:hypothetical protein